jgi:hypothetical protein
MKSLLLLGLSVALLAGCSKPSTVFIPVQTPHPTVNLDGFSSIDSKEFNATRSNGMICLTQDDFVDLTVHLRHSRMANNKLLEHIIEFNKSVGEINERGN